MGNLNVNRYLNITQDKILETILDLHELEEYLTNDWFLYYGKAIVMLYYKWGQQSTYITKKYELINPRNWDKTSTMYKGANRG